MKRIVIFTVILVLVFAGAASAASVMKVSINGKTTTLKTAPSFQNNVLMVPLEEVVVALGMTAKWDVASNTLEVTDTRADQITRLQGELTKAQSELAALKAKIPAANTTVTKENLISELQKRFGSVKIADQTITVRWYTFTSSGGDQHVSAETNADGRLAYLRIRLAGKEDELKQWFLRATELSEAVYPKRVVSALVARDEYSSYPTARWDDVSLGDNLKWKVTEYIFWYSSADGVTTDD